MFAFNRNVSRAQKVLCKGFNAGNSFGQPVLHSRVIVIGKATISDKPILWGTGSESTCIEGFQGEVRDLSLTEARHVLKQTAEYLAEGPSIQGTQGHHTVTTGSASDPTTSDSSKARVLEGLGCRVSLHGCMQSTVPSPQQPSNPSGGYGSHLNMPGASGGGKLMQKYLSSSMQSFHPSRQFSTSSRQLVSQQSAEIMEVDENELLTDPTPQGIQGDNCVSFKLWMENCQRYNLPNCDEQLEALKKNRKTLAEVFSEQEQMIRLVAESYRKKQAQQAEEMAKATRMSDCGQQAQQDYFNYSFEHMTDDPCPQGLQGEDCATFKAWEKNCKMFGFPECDKQLHDFKKGRRTLQDLFDEQDELIRNVVHDFYQKRSYGTSAKNSQVNTSSNSNTNNSNDKDSKADESMPPPDNDKLSSKDKLKRAVKEYGTTVIVFHIGISLISLGGFYMLVTSGFEEPLIQLLCKLGVSESLLQSKLATGSTTFAVAYIIHKCFAPVRIGITLTCAPLLVMYLRRVGFLKPPKPKLP